MATDWRSAIRFLGGSREEEARLIEEMTRQVRRVVENFTDDNHGKRLRPQHAKMLAGIKNAEFRVSPNLAEDLRVGFLKPGASYQALVRFSNAAGVIKEDDAEKDLRGAAIKIKPSEGEVQDFLMTNAEKHHAKNALEAMAISLSFSKENKLAAIADFIKRVGPIDAPRIILTVSRQMKIPVESLATETFWSRAPLRIGEVVVKYRLSPTVQKVTPQESNHNLTEDLTRRLAQGEVRFEFQVQRYINENLTPLEDARKAWESPFKETVAELILPQQALVNDKDFFDSLDFNPWHINTTDFEPLGNMNRARKQVYPASVAARKQEFA